MTFDLYFLASDIVRSLVSTDHSLDDSLDRDLVRVEAIFSILALMQSQSTGQSFEAEVVPL